MSSRYPPTTYSNAPAYSPLRPNHAPSYDPQTSSLVTPGSYTPTTQFRADAYGRQQQPGPAHSGRGIYPSQPGRPQYLPDRTGQPYGTSGQYRQDVNSSHETQMYAPADMTRGFSSGSHGTDHDSPQSHSSSEGPKERPWICLYPGCLNNGHLTSFVRKDDLNRHLRVHMPYRELYSCPVPGCGRVGDKGLPRKDKLLEHIKTHRGRG